MWPHNESIRHVGQECFLLRQVNLMMTKYHLRYLMVICIITRTMNFLNSWWFISYQHTLYSCQKYFKTIFFSTITCICKIVGTKPRIFVKDEEDFYVKWVYQSDT